MSGIRVMHVVRPAAGGIKSHLLSLIGISHGAEFHHMVACPPGGLADSLGDMGIEVFSIPLAGEISPAGDLAVIRKLSSLIKSKGVHVVHAHSHKAGLVARVAARWAGGPAMVLTVHSSVYKDSRPQWEKSLFALCESLLAGFTGRIIAVSRDLGREMADLGRISPEKIITIYNGISPGQFHREPDREYLKRATGISARKMVVGTVARLAPQKGVENFIRAAALVAREFDSTAFLVIGDGPLRGELERKAAVLGLGGRLFFAGERPDVPIIMPCLDVFVLASLTEGLPVTVLEALAARRPVVATRVGGVPEIITDGVDGRLVDPGDITGLAAAVMDLLGDRDKSGRLGKEGGALVERRFTVEEMAVRTERVYMELVSGGCGRQDRMF